MAVLAGIFVILTPYLTLTLPLVLHRMEFFHAPESDFQYFAQALIY